MRPYAGLHSCQTIKMNSRHSDQCSLLQCASTFCSICLDMVLTLLKTKKLPPLPLQGLYFIQIAFWKIFRSFCFTQNLGAICQNRRKQREGVGGKKKLIFFTKQMGLADILKERWILALSSTRDLKIVPSTMDIFVFFLHSLEVQTTL